MVTEQQVRELAYLIWESADRPEDDGVQWWLQAEEILNSSPPKRKVAAKVSPKQQKKQ